jgi:hydrogenase expression/formation protein HypD
MLEGISRLVTQVVNGEASVENVYNVAVSDEGNQIAQQLMMEIFQEGAAVWRAMGRIDGSGLVLRATCQRYDACTRYGLDIDQDYSSPGCICGEVIQGKAEPTACSLFGSACSPTRPIGPCMVSSEGTCAAWYKYGRSDVPGPKR